MFLRQFFESNLGLLQEINLQKWASLSSPRKLGPNSCLTNNFLYYEFQLFVFSTSKISLRRTIFLEEGSPQEPPNLVQLIVSQIISYIMSFNFLWWVVQKFHFRGPFIGGVLRPKFGPNNCITNNFLHYDLQLSMLSSSKILLWKGHLSGVGGGGLTVPQ